MPFPRTVRGAGTNGARSGLGPRPGGRRAQRATRPSVGPIYIARGIAGPRIDEPPRPSREPRRRSTSWGNKPQLERCSPSDRVQRFPTEVFAFRLGSRFNSLTNETHPANTCDSWRHGIGARGGKAPHALLLLLHFAPTTIPALPVTSARPTLLAAEHAGDDARADARRRERSGRAEACSRRETCTCAKT